MKYSAANPPIQCIQRHSTCYQGTTRFTPRGILWHDTDASNPYISRYVQPHETDGDYEEKLALLGKNRYGNDWNHKPRQAGMNAFIGKLADGTVASVQTMPWNYAPWGCGSGSKGSLNNTHMQFEICDDGYESREYFAAVYREACEITAYLCTLYGLDPMGSFSYNGVQVPVITSHDESHDLKMGSNHGDPIKWLKKYGKTMDDVRRDIAALMRGEEATAAPEPHAYTVALRPMKQGNSGEDVRALQILLSGRGSKTDADGIFGPKTKKAVEDYQIRAGLVKTGVANEETMRSLMGAQE